MYVIEKTKKRYISCWTSKNQKETTFSKLTTTIIFFFSESPHAHTGCSTNSIPWGRSWLLSTPPYNFNIGEWLDQLGEWKLLPLLKLPENVEYKRYWELCDLMCYTLELSCHISLVWNTYNICQFAFFSIPFLSIPYKIIPI